MVEPGLQYMLQYEMCDWDQQHDKKVEERELRMHDNVFVMVWLHLKLTINCKDLLSYLIFLNCYFGVLLSLMDWNFWLGFCSVLMAGMHAY